MPTLRGLRAKCDALFSTQQQVSIQRRKREIPCKRILRESATPTLRGLWAKGKAKLSAARSRKSEGGGPTQTNSQEERARHALRGHSAEEKKSSQRGRDTHSVRPLGQARYNRRNVRKKAKGATHANELSGRARHPLCAALGPKKNRRKQSAYLRYWRRIPSTVLIYIIGEASPRRACIWAVIASARTNHSNSRATRAGRSGGPACLSADFVSPFSLGRRRPLQCSPRKGFLSLPLRRPKAW